MVRVQFIRIRNDPFETALDIERRLAGGQRYPVGDAENMRVDRDRRSAKRRVHHDICGLAANPRKCFESLAIVRNFAAEIVDKQARQSGHMLGLGP